MNKHQVPAPAVWIANTNVVLTYAGQRVQLRRHVTTVEDGHPLVEMHPGFFDRPQVTTWSCARCGVRSSAPLCPEHHPPVRKRGGRVTLATEAGE